MLPSYQRICGVLCIRAALFICASAIIINDFLRLPPTRRRVDVADVDVESVVTHILRTSQPLCVRVGAKTYSSTYSVSARSAFLKHTHALGHALAQP